MKLNLKNGFLVGALISGSLVSAITLGMPAISSLNIFSAGSVISSSQVNANFEKLAGTVILSGSFGSAPRYVDDTDLVNHPSGCSLNSSAGYCLNERLDFNVDYVNDPSLILNKSEGITTYTSPAANYKIYKIDTDGWYELSLISDFTYTKSLTCTYPGCSFYVQFNLGFRLHNLDGSNNIVNPTTGYGASTSLNLNQNDNDSDGSFSNNQIIESFIYRGDRREIYLKAGTGITLELFASHNFSFISGNYSVHIPANGIRFKIIKLYKD